MSVDNHLEHLSKPYAEALQLHARGELEQAVRLYEDVLRELPHADVVAYNLGLAWYQLHEYDRARECFSQATSLNPAEGDYWFNLALSYNRLGDFAEAVRAYRRALELHPDDLDILYSLGCCCKDCGAEKEAITVYTHIVERNPQYTPALGNLAYLLHRRGEYAEAKQYYQRLLAIDPDHPGARHMVKALQGKAHAAPPPQYVQDLFDQYAEGFEENLVEELDYRAPHHLWRLFTRGPRRDRYAHCLDLGCGTGLCGELFRACSDVLTGIDLSPKMIEQAENKRLYDHLQVAEVVAYLGEPRPAFDLVLAADVFVYLGDLEPVFAALIRTCSDRLHFCFSIETGDQGQWQLLPSGRYSHTDGYIRRLAEDYGMHVRAAERVDLRMEKGRGVEGMVYFLTLTP